MKAKIAITILSAGMLFIPAAPTLDSAEQNGSQRPFFEARKQQPEYAGPGREDPEPKDLTEVRIGYFGPSDPAHPDGGDIWQAVNLAIVEANAEGGYRGLPFRLVPGWAENPWGNGVNQVTRMAYLDGVWAIIGGIDGPSAHLAAQVVAKARLTLINPASSDKTVNLANVPWVFSASPGDQLLAPVVGEALLQEAGDKTFVVVAATDHDSHQFLIELEKYFARRHAAPSYRFEFQSGRQDHADMARQAVAAKPKAVALVAGARDSASLLTALRKEGYVGKVFGGPAMGRRLFLERLEGGGVFFPLADDPRSEVKRFGKAFAERFGFPADFAAAHAYESTRMLVSAIRAAGLNRARICDALRQLSPWTGAAARIQWDSLGQNQSRVTLAGK